MRTDLHIHTTASDGRWTPRQLVEHIQSTEIRLFAVADHDILAGAIQAAELARQANLAFIPAVEISTKINTDGYHILAYGVDTNNVILNQLLAANQKRLNWADDELLRRLAQAGYPIDLAAYDDYQNDRTRGGWKSLNFLIDVGLCRDAKDFFENLFTPFAPPPPDFPHPAQACSIIRAAGGLPVLAHPGTAWYKQGVSEQALAPFIEFGIAGLECYTCHHDQATTQTCLAFCKRHDLLITGGSDYHGGFVGRQLGVPVINLEDLHLGPLLKYVNHD